MPTEFRLAVEAQNVEFKAFARQFEHPGDEDEPPRRAVVYLIATMSYPDSGWQVTVAPVEGTHAEEWVLLEDPPGFGDRHRTFVIASGVSEHEVEAVPKTLKVRYADNVTRVSVVPWD